MNHETYVGIVHTLPNDSKLTLVVLHPGNKTVTHGSWDIQTYPHNPFESVDGGMRLKDAPDAYPDAFTEITNALKSRCGVSTRILIEYPPGQIIATAPFSQLVAFLIREGFGSCVIDFGDDSTIVHFREIPEEQKPATMMDDLLFLANAKARAYAMFLFDCDSCSDSQHALAAALIAMNLHLHRYLKSRGVVFSSQDVALFLNDPDSFNPLVISGDTAYYLSMTSSGHQDAEDLHLEYATALKRFSFLPSGEGLKFAVLSVCKQMGLRLHCLSVQDPRSDRLLDEDTLGPNEYVAFDPSERLPTWIGVPRT